MIIQCTLSLPQQSIWDYAKKITTLPPLPAYIAKRSAHIIREGTDRQVIVLYEFGKSNLSEAMEYICKQLACLQDGSEFCLSVHSCGSHLWCLKLDKNVEV